jgi:enoyl-CoA hydratase/carnithine racemase
LIDALEHAVADQNIRALVVTGEKPAFSSGADLQWLRDDPPDRETLDRSFRLIDVISDAPVPVIAAIDGPAAGAGWGLALACDVRLASPRSRFVAPFIEMGLVPDFGLSRSLPALAGRDAALEICLSGRAVTAQEAYERGLLTALADRPVEAACELAETFAARPAGAVRLTKRILQNGGHHAEAKLQARLIRSPGFRERLQRWQTR